MLVCCTSTFGSERSREARWQICSCCAPTRLLNGASLRTSRIFESIQNCRLRMGSRMRGSRKRKAPEHRAAAFDGVIYTRSFLGCVIPGIEGQQDRLRGRNDRWAKPYRPASQKSGHSPQCPSPGRHAHRSVQRCNRFSEKASLETVASP